MASQRKTASRARAAKPAKKKAVHAKPARTKAKPGPARAAVRRPARPAKTARPVAKKKTAVAAPAAKKKTAPAVKAAPAAKKPATVLKSAVAVPKKKGAAAPAPASKKAPVKMRAVPRPPAPVPEVRPLGVLPPEARARGVERTPHGSAIATRPAVVNRTHETAKGQGVERVTDSDMKGFEEQLLAERGRLMKEMGHLETTVLKVNPRDSAGDLSGYSFHMADAGTDAYEREKAFQFASTEGRLLMEINEALRRVYNGEYGTCETCGSPIGKARLEAVLYARLCRDCKEKEERERRREP